MSKWLALRGAVFGNRNETIVNSSIHRFEGFDVVKKLKTYWLGFVFHVPVCELSNFLDRCPNILRDIDYSELTIRCCVANDPERNLLFSYFSDHKVCTIDHCDLNRLRFHSFTSDNRDTVFDFRIYAVDIFPVYSVCEYWKHSVTYMCDDEEDIGVIKTREDVCIEFLTRESSKHRRIGAAGILSNQLHGVDNTGNVRIWSSEGVLLHTILRSAYLRSKVKGKVVLELGAGMTGLCGLGLAISGLPLNMVLTDGHPDCVSNQRNCVAMNTQLYDNDNSNNKGVDSSSACDHTKREKKMSSIESRILRWSLEDTNGELAAVTCHGRRRFDVIMASDCLFFSEFHDALLHVIDTCLVRGDDDRNSSDASNAASSSTFDNHGGLVLLLQPPRGRTMQVFIAKAIQHGFEVKVEEDYDPDITSMRLAYQAEESTRQQMKTSDTGDSATSLKSFIPFYDEDIHFPRLVTLSRKKMVVSVS